MAKYSIKDLEKFSGIKAHTLRIWEKRYDLLCPDRTDTNIRYYSDKELKKLLNVSILSDSGMRISEIAELSLDALQDRVREIEDDAVMNQKRVNDLVAAMIDFDEELFQKHLDEFINSLGFEKAMTEIVYPFLEKVGILWLSDDIQPAQEHYITHIIRNRIIMAIESIPRAKGDKKAILFLPEGEYHELGLLYFYFLIKKKGVRVYYLGQSVPIDQVRMLSNQISPNWVVSYSVIKKKNEIEEFLQEMNQLTANENFFFENKYQVSQGISYPSNVSQATELDQLLSKIG